MKKLTRRPGLFIGAATAALFVFVLEGCDRFRRPELTVPTAEEAATFYAGHDAVAAVEVTGNVVEVQVRQPPEQLRRGGSLWAKVGPYIYLFSPDTRSLLEAYPGVAAVRVVTYAGKDTEVARVMMRRDTLSDILWRRSQNILGHALQRGTEQPTRLEELVNWGERYTDFTYSEAYVPR